MEIIQPRNWRDAKAKFGPVRKRQIWVNRVFRNQVMVSKKVGEAWRCENVAKEGSHLIDERVLYKYFDLLK